MDLSKRIEYNYRQTLNAKCNCFIVLFLRQQIFGLECELSYSDTDEPCGVLGCGVYVT